MVHRIDKHIERLVYLELKESKRIFEEYFNSPHEGYAIIAEEYEEAEHELRKVKDKLDALWDDTKEDNIDIDYVINVSKMLTNAMSLASEAIQIAAMAKKLVESVDEWGD